MVSLLDLIPHSFCTKLTKAGHHCISNVHQLSHSVETTTQQWWKSVSMALTPAQVSVWFCLSQSSVTLSNLLIPLHLCIFTQKQGQGK